VQVDKLDKEIRELELLDKIIADERMEVYRLKNCIKEIKNIESSFFEEKDYYFRSWHKIVEHMVEIVKEIIRRRNLDLRILEEYYKDLKNI